MRARALGAGVSGLAFLACWVTIVLIVFELGAREFRRHRGLDSFDVPPPVPYRSDGRTPEDYDG